MLYLKSIKRIKNKKAFQSNANRPLSDSPYFMVNKFEPALYSRGTVRPGPWTGTLPAKQTVTTENITFLQLRWRMVRVNTFQLSESMSSTMIQ